MQRNESFPVDPDINPKYRRYDSLPSFSSSTGFSALTLSFTNLSCSSTSASCVLKSSWLQMEQLRQMKVKLAEDIFYVLDNFSIFIPFYSRLDERIHWVCFFGLFKKATFF